MDRKVIATEERVYTAEIGPQRTLEINIRSQDGEIYDVMLWNKKEDSGISSYTHFPLLNLETVVILRDLLTGVIEQEGWARE